MIYKRDGITYSCYEEYCMIGHLDNIAKRHHKRSSSYRHKSKHHKKEGREMKWQKRKQN